jgi:hypothetical protein
MFQQPTNTVPAPEFADIYEAFNNLVGPPEGALPASLYSNNPRITRERVIQDLWNSFSGFGWEASRMFVEQVTVFGSYLRSLFPTVNEKQAQQMKPHMDIKGDRVTSDTWIFSASVFDENGRRNPGTLLDSERDTKERFMHHQKKGFKMPMDFLIDPTKYAVYTQYIKTMDESINLTWEHRIMVTLDDEALVEWGNKWGKILPLPIDQLEVAIFQRENLRLSLGKNGARDKAIESHAVSEGRERKVQFDTMMIPPGALRFINLITPDARNYAYTGPDKDKINHELNSQDPNPDRTQLYKLKIYETRSFAVHGDSLVNKTLRTMVLGERFILPGNHNNYKLDETYKSDRKTLQVTDGNNISYRVFQELELLFAAGIWDKTDEDNIGDLGRELLRVIAHPNRKYDYTAAGVSGQVLRGTRKTLNMYDNQAIAADDDVGDPDHDPSGDEQDDYDNDNDNNMGVVRRSRGDTTSDSSTSGDDNDDDNNRYGRHQSKRSRTNNNNRNNKSLARTEGLKAWYDRLPSYLNVFRLYRAAGIVDEVVNQMAKRCEDDYTFFNALQREENIQTEKQSKFERNNDDQYASYKKIQQRQLEEDQRLISKTQARRMGVQDDDFDPMHVSTNVISVLRSRDGRDRDEETSTPTGNGLSFLDRITGKNGKKSSNKKNKQRIQGALDSQSSNSDSDMSEIAGLAGSDLIAIDESNSLLPFDKVPPQDIRSEDKKYTKFMKLINDYVQNTSVPQTTLDAIFLDFQNTIIKKVKELDLTIPDAYGQTDKKLLWSVFNTMFAYVVQIKKTIQQTVAMELASKAATWFKAVDDIITSRHITIPTEIINNNNTRTALLWNLFKTTTTYQPNDPNIAAQQQRFLENARTSFDSLTASPASRTATSFDKNRYPFIPAVIGVLAKDLPAIVNNSPAVVEVLQQFNSYAEELANPNNKMHKSSRRDKKAVFVALTKALVLEAAKQPSMSINKMFDKIQEYTSTNASLVEFMDALDDNLVKSLTKFVQDALARGIKRGRDNDDDDDDDGGDSDDDSNKRIVSSRDRKFFSAKRKGAVSGGQLVLKSKKRGFADIDWRVQCKAILKRLRITKNVFRILHKYDVILPFGYILFRWPTIITGPCTFFKSGADTALAIYKDASVIFTTDTRKFDVYIDVFFSSLLFVDEPKNLEYVPETYGIRYVGGAGCTLFDYYTDITRYHEGQSPADIHVVLTPFAWQPEKPYTDHIGKFSTSVCRGYNPDHYPTYAPYCNWKRDAHAEGVNPWTADFIRAGNPRFTTIMIQGTQRLWKPSTNGPAYGGALVELIEGKNALGTDCRPLDFQELKQAMQFGNGLESGTKRIA